MKIRARNQWTESGNGKTDRSPEPPEPLLLFDGDCNLCSGIVQFILRNDKKGRIKLAALQSPEGKSVIDMMSPGTTLPDSIVFIRGNRVWTESSAALELASELGGIWSAARVLKIFPSFFLDWCYRIIARNRYRIWGKSTDCLMPEPGWENRFPGGKTM